MNVLVTGGTGFIGTHLVRALCKEGHHVIATGSPGCETDLDVPIFPHGPMGINWGHLQSKLGGSLDILFHQAANNDTTWNDYVQMEYDNAAVALEVFKKCRDFGCRKIIYASSTAVYGNLPIPHKESGKTSPLNAYATSKLMLEQSARIFNSVYPEVTLIGLRYCNVYGPGEVKKGRRASMIYQIANRIKSKPVKLFGDGEQKRDYIYIDDVVRANLLAMECNQTRVINCGTGQAVSFNKIYDIIAKQLNKRSWDGPIYIDNPLGDRYQVHTQCDMQLAKEILGFVPKYDIETGIAQYNATGELR